MANLRIAELDFDQIKTNLKNYLQAQEEFSDYDFEGSGLAVLLDILAYNTHYNAYLANMVANEMFLDSAVKRSSVVSIAKHLGYTPRSVIGAAARLDITVNNPTGLPASLTLERYTPFSSSIGGISYTFYNTEPVTIQADDNTYTFQNVQVKQGTPLDYSYTVVTPGPDEKYEIPNAAVDVSTMLVTVQASSTDTTQEIYTLATDLTDISSTSKVYFLEENPFGNYQIYFGDNVLGKKLSTGNIINIRYLSSLGPVCNVSESVEQSFTADSTIGGSNDIDILVVSNSTGGTDRETVSSIKFNAPKFNLTKNRAVTKNDYASIIKSQYTQIESISVWGGEENEPPAYGKVFISLKPYQDFVVDDDTKTSIKNTLLAERQILTVSPEFVDPDYIHVNIIANINYNRNLTTVSSSSINALARTAIVNYFATELQQYEKPFYHSQLVEILNNIDPSVLSVILELKIQKRITPVLNVSNSYIDGDTIKFKNKLHPGELSSTRFQIVRNGVTVPVVMYDSPDVMPPNYNGTGTIKLKNADDNTVYENIGTVNYATGDVTISSIIPVGYPANQFDIRITSSLQEDSYNITTARNQIIVYDDSTASVTANRDAGITINVTSV